MRRICHSHTKLSSEDIAVLETLEMFLQLIADLTRSDVFIDCPARDSSSAVVVAHAKPTTGDSLYRSSVAGQLALRDKEPGVLRTLEYGIPTHSTRGVSQEGVCVSQSAIPIQNAAGATIGCLIMERNVTEHFQQKARVELLENRAHVLTESLLQFVVDKGQLSDILPDGIVVVDASGTITYVNASARYLFSELYDVASPEGTNVEVVLGNGFTDHEGLGRAVQLEKEIRMHSKTLLVRVVPLFDEEEHLAGAFLTMRDVTQDKEKERQLLAKTMAIRQVHHKIKNDLHTLAALLRMRQRHCQSEEGRQAYLEAISLLNTIATFHEMSTGVTSQFVDARDIVHRIMRNMQEQYQFAGKLNMGVSGTEVKIASGKTTPIALIVHELIQNCLKHAAEPDVLRVSVHLDKADSFYRIRISDNGKGFDERVLLGEKQGIGLQVANVLVREVFGGNVHLRNEGGAVVELEFPATSMEG